MPIFLRNKTRSNPQTRSNTGQKLIVNIRPVIQQYSRNELLNQIFPYFSLASLIEAVLCVSIAHQDTEHVWNLLENSLGQRFETLDINELSCVIDNLMTDLDAYIQPVLPEHWHIGSFIFDQWVGQHDVLVAQDGS